MIEGAAGEGGIGAVGALGRRCARDRRGLGVVAFQVSSTPQSFRIDCYGLEGEDMNLFIDIS